MKKILPILLFLSFAGCVQAQSGYHSYGWKRLIGAPYTLTDFTDTLGIVLDTNAFGGQVDTLRAPWDTNTYLFYDGHHHLKWVPITGGSGISQIYGRYPIQIYGTDTVAWNPNLLTKVTISPATDDTPLVIHANNSVGEIPIFTAWSSGGSPTKLFQIGDDGELYFAPTGGLIDGSGSAGSAGQVLESQGSATLTPLWTTLSINNSIYADTVLNNTLTFYDTIQAGEHDNFRHTTNNIYYYATMDASSVLTGIDTSLQNGYFLCIQNQSYRPNGIIVLDNENTASKPQNRIMTGIGKDLVIARFENALLVYVPKYDTDAGGVGDTVGRWVVVGGTAYERNSTGNTNYIYNQFSSAQTSSNFWIDGTGQVGSLNVAPGASNSEGTITTTTTLPLSSFLYKLPYHGGTFIVGDTGAGILTVTAPLKITNADGVTTISDTATGGDSVRASHIADTAKVAHYADTAKSAYTATNLLGTIANSIYINGIGRTPTLALLLADTTAATSSLPSFGPYLDLRGQIYNAANQEGDVRIYDSTSTASNSVKTLQSFVVEGRTNSGTYNNFLTYQQNSGGNGDNLYVGNTNNSGLSLKFDVGGNAAGIFGGTSSGYPGGFTLTSGIGSTTRGGGGFGFYSAHTGVAGQAKLLSIDLKSVATNATDSATFTFGSAFFPEIVYTPTTISAVNAGITVPFGTVISVNHGTETGSFPITIPAGTAGQQLTIQNNTSYPTGGTVIDPGATQSFVYQNSAWQLLGQNPLFRELKITATINAAAAPTTTTTLYTMPTTGFTYFEPVFVILRVVSVSGGPTAGTLQIGSAPAPTSILGTTTEPVTSVGNCTLSLSSLSGGNVAPITPGTAIISTIATSAAPGTLIIAADIWGIYVP